MQLRSIPTFATIAALAAAPANLEAASPTLNFSVQAQAGQTPHPTRSLAALEVARCVASRGETEQVTTPDLTADVGTLMVRTRDRAYFVLALDPVGSALPDTLLLLDTLLQSEGYLDVGLDGYSDESHPSSSGYGTALNAVLEVCRSAAKVTTSVDSRGRKDCPNDQMGVAALSMLYRQYAPSIVQLQRYSSIQGIPGDYATSRCSGYFVGDGIIATSRHCIGEESSAGFKEEGSLEVSWPAEFDSNGRISHVYTTPAVPLILFENAIPELATDLALIGINPRAPQQAPLPLKTSTTPQTKVASFGHPLGASWTLAAIEGSVQFTDHWALGQKVEVDFPDRCNVGPGNSGGPLMNPFGQVLGTIEALRTDDPHHFLAVPSAHTADLLREIQPQLSQIHAQLQGSPVYRCTVEENPTLLTSNGLQYTLEPDPTHCTLVAGRP